MKNYLKILSLLVFLSFTHSDLFASYYKTRATNASGNWNINTTWLKSADGVTYANAGVGSWPGAGDNVIVSTGTVNILVTASCSYLTVSSTLTTTLALSLNISGDLSVSSTGTFSMGTLSTVVFNGTSGTQNVSSASASTLTFNNVTKNTASTVLQGSDVIINGTLNISSGGYDADVYDLSGTANLTMTGGDLYLSHVEASSSPQVPKLQGTYSLSGTSTIHLLASGIQTIRYSTGTTFNNLELGSGGNRKWVKSSLITINGNLTISNGSLYFNAGSYTLTLKGNLIVNGGSIDAKTNTGTIDFNGNTTISGTSTNVDVYNATISGTLTASSATTLSVSGNFNNSGTFTNSGGTVIFNGSAGSITGTTATTFTNITVNGPLTGPSSSTLTVKGNWSNNSSYSANGGTVLLNGTSAQTISGTYVPVFNNLTLSNANGLTLSKDVDVANTLTLSSGALNLNQQKLTITNSSTSAISAPVGGGYIVSEDNSLNAMLRANDLSRVQWNTTSTGTFTVPFAIAGGTSIPVSVAVTSGNAGNLTFATYNTAAANTPYPSTVSHVKNNSKADNSASTVDRFWELSASGTTYVATLTFSYTTAEVPANGEAGTDGAGLAAQRWNGSYWSAATASQTPNAALNKVTTPGITNLNFSGPWALALHVSPLPVKLVYFKGNYTNKAVPLNWETATEINSDYFTVERSGDGIQWESLGEIKGAGNSTSSRNYNFTDKNPIKGISYYRLTQTDGNGAIEVFSPLAVDVNEPNLSAGITAYPNPAINESTILKLEGFAAQQITLSIFDELGHLEFFKTIDVSGNNFSTALNDLFTLNSGLHFVSVQSTEGLYKEKILVRN